MTQVVQTKGLSDPELATKSGKTTFTEYQKIFNILPRFPNSVSSYKRYMRSAFSNAPKSNFADSQFFPEMNTPLQSLRRTHVTSSVWRLFPPNNDTTKTVHFQIDLSPMLVHFRIDLSPPLLDLRFVDSISESDTKMCLARYIPECDISPYRTKLVDWIGIFKRARLQQKWSPLAGPFLLLF